MSNELWTTVAIWEGASLHVMARIVDLNGELINQDSVGEIRYRVVAERISEVIPVATLDKTAVIYDTPQNNPAWGDGDGFNFSYIFPADHFPDGNVSYSVSIEIDDTTAPTPHTSGFGVVASAVESLMDTPKPA